MQNNLLKCKNLGSRKWIALLTLFFFILVLIPLQAQQKLKVEGDLIVQSADTGPPRYGLIARPQRQPSSAEKGEVYYDEGEKKFCWYDGVGWSTMGSGEEYIATRVVAAYNSAGSTRDGTNPCTIGGTCVNPKADYTCDGTFDEDTINAALNSLAAGVRGVVYLLEGTYDIRSSPVQITSDNVALVGAGKGTVLRIGNNGSTDKAIYVLGDRVLISQLSIDGNKSNNTNEIAGIYLWGVESFKIDKVWVENMTGDGIVIEGDPAAPSRHNIIVNSCIRNNDKNGIRIYKSDDNIISGNFIENNNWQYAGLGGIAIEGSADAGLYSRRNIISGNVIKNNADYGIGTGDFTSLNMAFNNQVRDNSSIGIYMVGSFSSDYKNLGNIVSANNIQGGTGAFPHGIMLDGENSIISGNILRDIAGCDSIYIPYICSVVISGNRIYDSTTVAGFPSNGIWVAHYNKYIFGNLVDGPALVGTTFDTRIFDASVASQYTDKAKITLDRAVVSPANGSTLDTSSSPRAYVAFVPNSASSITLSNTTAIANGKVAGDMLILEGTSDTYTFTIPHNANTVLSAGAAKTLGKDDTLSLIWNGIDWIEIGYCDNQ